MKNEFRRGNLVKAGNKITIIESLDANGINLSSQLVAKEEKEYDSFILPDYEYKEGEIEFIPITRQWLKELGFKLAFSASHDNVEIWKKDGFGLVFDGTKLMLDTADFSKEMKFVHTLQNTYFILEEKELELSRKIESELYGVTETWIG